MTFDFPAKTNKIVATSTAAVYKSKLNKLATYGFNDVAALKSRAGEVIQAITNIAPGDTEQDRHKRRYFLSAIFWVAKFPKRNRYYTFWQKCIPLKDDKTGENWVKNKAYQINGAE
jgi:hypothetical protein